MNMIDNQSTIERIKKPIFIGTCNKDFMKESSLLTKKFLNFCLMNNYKGKLEIYWSPVMEFDNILIATDHLDCFNFPPMIGKKLITGSCKICLNFYCTMMKYVCHQVEVLLK